MLVHYKCRCQPVEQTIPVPDRRPDTDIIQWMNMVQVCIGTDHSGMSPNCRATKMEYAKIPFDDGSPGVGIPATRQ